MSNIKRTLEDILTDITRNTARATTDVNLIPASTRAGFEIAVRQAKENLAALQKEYRAAVFSNMAGFFLTGDTARVAEFTAIAAKQHNMLVFDANKLYSTIATIVEPSIGKNREFTINQWTLFINAIRNVAIECGLTGSLPAPKLAGNAVTVVKTSADLVAFVRTLIRNAMGDNLFVAYASNEISKAALAAQLATPLTTVAVVNAGIDESRALAPSFKIRRSVKVPASGDLEKFANGCIDRLREPPVKKSEEKKTDAETS